MISTLTAFCVIALAFRQLILVCCAPGLEWNAPPLWLLLITTVSAAHLAEFLHRRLT